MDLMQKIEDQVAFRRTRTIVRGPNRYDLMLALFEQKLIELAFEDGRQLDIDVRALFNLGRMTGDFNTLFPGESNSSEGWLIYGSRKFYDFGPFGAGNLQWTDRNWGQKPTEYEAELTWNDYVGTGESYACQILYSTKSRHGTYFETMYWEDGKAQVEVFTGDTDEYEGRLTEIISVDAPGPRQTIFDLWFRRLEPLLDTTTPASDA